MKTTTLLIMAAGIGSRFGTGIKQLEPVGLHDEIIMDYSIHDAIEAGFNKIIFVIRKDIEEDFRERIGNRVEAICKALRQRTCSMNRLPLSMQTITMEKKHSGNCMTGCSWITRIPLSLWPALF